MKLKQIYTEHEIVQGNVYLVKLYSGRKWRLLRIEALYNLLGAGRDLRGFDIHAKGDRLKGYSLSPYADHIYEVPEGAK